MFERTQAMRHGMRPLGSSVLGTLLEELEEILTPLVGGEDVGPEPYKFKVGDYVRVTSNNGFGEAVNARRGEYGEVVDLTSWGDITVKFARPDKYSHDCGEKTEDNHGVWFVPRMLELAHV